MLMSLGFVVGISMVKDIYEDFQRHQSDKEENNRVALACEPRQSEQLGQPVYDGYRPNFRY